MQENNKRFEFSQEEINYRFIQHWTYAEHFIEAIWESLRKKEKNCEIIINTRLLYLAIESTFQDIARYKNYHQEDPWEEKLDAVKRCAFLIKWIPRMKPIQVLGLNKTAHDIQDESRDQLELLNEMLCIYYFELHLSDEIDLNIAISEKKMQQLAYDLLYRNISNDGWIAILQLIKDCCHPKFVRGVPFLSRL